MHLLGLTLLLVSLVSLTTYSISFYRLTQQAHHKGLVRTATCRIVAALIYIAVGVVSTVGSEYSTVVALIAFVIVQLIWQSNSIADVMITKRENKHARIYRTTQCRHWKR